MAFTTDMVAVCESLGSSNGLGTSTKLLYAWPVGTGMPPTLTLSTSQSAVMFCGWGVKEAWLSPLLDACVGGR